MRLIISRGLIIYSLNQRINRCKNGKIGKIIKRYNIYIFSLYISIYLKTQNLIKCTSSLSCPSSRDTVLQIRCQHFGGTFSRAVQVEMFKN